MGLIRLVIIGFVLMTILYGMLWLYSRSVRRERLEKRWDAENPGVNDPAAREAYVEKGMEAYFSSVRPKLLLLVYVIPVLLVIAGLIVTNWN